MESFSQDVAGYKALAEQKRKEDQRLGLSGLRQLGRQVSDIYLAPSEDEQTVPKGALASLESSIHSYEIAKSKRDHERAKASDAVFSQVWAAAQSVFQNEDVDLDACPVCDASFADSPHGARAGISVKLDAQMRDLADYQTAEEAFVRADKALDAAVTELKQKLHALNVALNDTEYNPPERHVGDYIDALDTWRVGDPKPKDTELIAFLTETHCKIVAEEARIEENQGEHTYANALKIADELIALKFDLRRIDNVKARLVELQENLEHQSSIINKTIVEYSQKLIGRLKDDVNDLYKDIQSNEADLPPIRLELPDEGEKNQQRLHLLIDFSDNRQGVPPSGYLSDSQIHAIALSLRLAAIRLFQSRIQTYCAR